MTQLTGEQIQTAGSLNKQDALLLVVVSKRTIHCCVLYSHSKYSAVVVTFTAVWCGFEGSTAGFSDMPRGQSPQQTAMLRHPHTEQRIRGKQGKLVCLVPAYTQHGMQDLGECAKTCQRPETGACRKAWNQLPKFIAG